MWSEKLRQHIEDEARDFEEYIKLAEEAEHDGCYKAAGVLRDIAREERTHEKLLAELQTEHK